MRPRACAPRARPPRAGGAQMVCLAAAWRRAPPPTPP